MRELVALWVAVRVVLGGRVDQLMDDGLADARGTVGHDQGLQRLTLVNVSYAAQSRFRATDIVPIAPSNTMPIHAEAGRGTTVAKARLW